MKTDMPPRCLNPECNQKLDNFTGVAGAELPTEGAAAVCLYCSDIALYTGNGLELRRPTPEELKQLKASPKVALALTITRIARALKIHERRDK